MSYIQGGKGNPFSEIEDVDDSTFLNHPRQGQGGYVLNNNDRSANVWEDKRRQLLEDRRKIEEETLQSSKRTLGLLYETEKVGLQTAEELLHQREQLQNVDEKLDSINSIMRVSQKHITSMKSIFGGFKNYFSKNGDSSSAVNGKRITPSISESKLHNTVESIRTVSDNAAQQNHPALRNRAVNPFDDEDKGVTPSSKVPSSTSAYDLHSRKVDQELDKNLEDVGMGISRLKELAMGLGNEIDSQNQLLDNLATKSERAGDTITNQNRQMKRILKS